MTRNKFLLPVAILLMGITACSTKSTTPPILVLATNAAFGSYTCEILKTEGFNEFKLDSLTDVNISLHYLKQFDIIILGKTAITQTQKTMFYDYVEEGGSLIAFIPDNKLCGLFGIDNTTGTVNEGYIALDPDVEQGIGIATNRMQIHGVANKYTLHGGKEIATLFTDKTSLSGFPGIVSNNYRKGHTTAFLYNLPQSIVLTRQGNPLFAGMEKDGIPGLRGMDLFTDSWVDTSNNTINQADEQMVLLSHCIENMLADKKPLPRFWYFPDTLKCLVTLTNDGEYKSEKDFDPQFRDVDSLGAKMSLYIIGVDKVSRAWVNDWTSKGFEIAGHPDDTKEASNPTWNRMDSVLRTRKNEIYSNYGLPMRTNVNHWFVWCGKNADDKQEFGAEARLEEKNGIELDINYAHYDIKSNQGEHYLGPLGTDQGNFTGSGLVMKFSDSKGKIINVYQQLNAVYDQEYNESHDPEGFFNCFKGLMDRSLKNEVYSFISVKSHNDEYYFSKSPLMKMLTYARQNKIPVWTELNLLDFLKMKDEATFSGLDWSDNQLTFKLSSYLKNSNGLTFLLPVNHGDLKIRQIVVNNQNRKFEKRKIKGFEYALITVISGNTYNISAKYE
jgi:hypothetical protein